MDTSLEDTLIVKNTGTTNTGMNLDANVVSESTHDLLNLLSKLPGGSQDQSLALDKGDVKMLQDTRTESCGFSSTRLCLLDHITSATALVLPVAAIARVLREHGVACLVDGAHAAGMVELDIHALGVDYYATNFHKWTCAPKGAGMLWVRPELRGQILPSVVSHGFSEPEPRRFQAMFDWTGTSDPTAWLCLGRTLEFMGSLLPGGWRQLREENHRLALQARDVLCAALACSKPAPDELLGSMAAIPLRPGVEPAEGDAARAPRTPDPLYRELARRGFEVVVANWPERPQRVLRVSAQLYNTLDEYERLAQALKELV